MRPFGATCIVQPAGSPASKLFVGCELSLVDVSSLELCLDWPVAVFGRAIVVDDPLSAVSISSCCYDKTKEKFNKILCLSAFKWTITKKTQLLISEFTQKAHIFKSQKHINNALNKCLNAKATRDIFIWRKIKYSSLIYFCLNSSSDTQMQLSISKILPKVDQMQHLDVAQLQEMRHHCIDLVMNDLNRCHQIGHSK